MYTGLQRYLLSAGVPSLGLLPLVEPTEFDLLEREFDIGWERETGTNDLIGTLRLLGVVFVPCPVFEESEL